MIGHWNQKKNIYYRVQRRNAVVSVISLDIIFCQMKKKIGKKEENHKKTTTTTTTTIGMLSERLSFESWSQVCGMVSFSSVVLYTACKTISDKSVYPLYCEILCHSLINWILMVAASTIINHVRCLNIHSECWKRKKKKKK